MKDNGGLTRRRFLGGALAGSGCLVLTGLAGLVRADIGPGGNFYVKNKVKLMDYFQQVNQGCQFYLTSRYNPEVARQVTTQAPRVLERLLPDLPDIGGEKNMMTPFLVYAAWYVAFFRAMKSQGLTAEDTGRMMYDLTVMKLGTESRQEAQKQGAELFKPQYLDKMRKWCAWSQKRTYPADWVGRFIDGRGADFDYGLDFSQCGAVLFFEKQKTLEVAPYFCLIDFPRSAHLGTGLVRTKTIALGQGVCDFRYKKGRPVKQTWETEVPKIKARDRS
jgi:hypothetical protein